MDTTRKDIGERIREIRKRAGKNQAELGAALGCKKGAVSKYERGASDPTPETLILIAKIGRASLDWLLTGEPAPLPPAEQEFDVKLEDDLADRFGSDQISIDSTSARVLLMFERLPAERKRRILDVLTDAYIISTQEERIP